MTRSTTTVEGWISNELRIRDAQGHRVVDVSVPVTPQRQVDGRWEDSGETVWYRASFWDETADAIMALVNKGSLVTITGTLKLDSWSSGAKSGVNAVLTRPTLSVIAAAPAKNAQRPKGAAPTEEVWAQSPPSEPDYAPWSAGDETPF